MHALENIILRGFLDGAAALDVAHTVGEHERNRIGARRVTMPLGGVSRPAGGEARFVFGKYCVGVPHRTVHRHRTDTGQRAAEVLLH